MQPIKTDDGIFKSKITCCWPRRRFWLPLLYVIFFVHIITESEDYIRYYDIRYPGVNADIYLKLTSVVMNLIAIPNVVSWFNGSIVYSIIYRIRWHNRESIGISACILGIFYGVCLIGFGYVKPPTEAGADLIYIYGHPFNYNLYWLVTEYALPIILWICLELVFDVIKKNIYPDNVRR